jgi:hypothetical protein
MLACAYKADERSMADTTPVCIKRVAIAAVVVSWIGTYLPQNIVRKRLSKGQATSQHTSETYAVLRMLSTPFGCSMKTKIYALGGVNLL